MRHGGHISTLCSLCLARARVWSKWSKDGPSNSYDFNSTRGTYLLVWSKWSKWSKHFYKLVKITYAMVLIAPYTCALANSRKSLDHLDHLDHALFHKGSALSFLTACLDRAWPAWTTLESLAGPCLDRPPFFQPQEYTACT